MKDLLQNQDLLRWLLGQSVALVLALLWIWTLRTQNSKLSRELTISTRRNEHLSDALLDRVERNSLERSRSKTEKLLIEKLSRREG